MTMQTREVARKQPTQDRARATVDAIVLAAAHILKTEGSERATTNRIEELSGACIGSLYQYFPNKAAVFAEVRKRHTEWYEKTLRDQVTRSSGPSLRDAMRPAVEQIVAMHRIDPALHNALATSERAVDAEGELFYQNLFRDFLVERASELRPLNAETVSYIAVRALEAVVHGTAIDDPARLDDPDFTTEVVELAVRYIEP